VGSGRIGSFRRDYREPNRAWGFEKEKWTRRPPRVLLYVKAVGAPKLVVNIYLKVPMFAELLFDEPQPMAEYPFYLQSAGRPLELKAKQLAEDKRVYRTEVFIAWPK
jgi:hypothetical protein